MSADICLNLGGTTDMNIFALSVKTVALRAFSMHGVHIYIPRRKFRLS